MLDKKDLSERHIWTKYIIWDLDTVGSDFSTQILEDVSFTDGKIYVLGKFTARAKKKRANNILYHNIPIAII